ncbi:hypothetical protein C8P63_1536 [Melghirimyces profundicolus]|uniref:Uncharacterized protein n=1 Tax=Melghirimyces profundicolus TaxID=1242148 RepID=A0A2T6ATU3_9BACL|nr:hypothetical protein C8P63_1536 [Melghirimyces profundicolus]
MSSYYNISFPPDPKAPQKIEETAKAFLRGEKENYNVMPTKVCLKDVLYYQVSFFMVNLPLTVIRTVS